MENEAAKALKEKLFYRKKNGLKTAPPETVEAAGRYCENYAGFLAAAKTERLAVREAVRLAEERGFAPYTPGAAVKPGDRVYVNNRGKSVILAVGGEKPAVEGVKIAAAHIDSPRLDLKPSPLYEDADLALFKTHYYGGIKKYQWTAIPLALYGVVIKGDGEKVDVAVGDAPGDPCFVISDLLPHLAQEQSKRTLADGIKGEELNVLVGSTPFRGDDVPEAVKLYILNLLYEKYGIREEDFLSAELECVPALPVRDLGFDRSMIGAYGHDDRVCAYPALTAALDTASPEHTVITVLTDKEETGSDGNTGLQSAYLRDFIEDLAAAEGCPGYRVLAKAQCLSADVNAAFDPTFPDVAERRNAAMLNCGAVITKYTGARGKSDTSDASAEFVGKIRRTLNDAGIVWQAGELGKVDTGGGGTVAKYIANLGADVVDLGVPVLSMHSPFEVVSKFDVYMTYLTVRAFFDAEM